MDRYGKWFMQAQHIEQCNPVVYFRLLTFKHNFCVNSCTKLKNGKLIGWTNNGAIMFAPELIHETRPQGNIFFQNITVSGRSIRTIPHLLKNIPVNQQKTLSLNYTQNNFMLELLPTGGSARNMKSHGY